MKQSNKKISGDLANLGWKLDNLEQKVDSKVFKLENEIENIKARTRVEKFFDNQDTYKRLMQDIIKNTMSMLGKLSDEEKQAITRHPVSVILAKIDTINEIINKGRLNE